MLDLKLLRANPEGVKAAMAGRGAGYAGLLDEIFSKDSAHRAAVSEIEELRSKSNEISKKIQAAKAAKDEGAVQAAMAAANAAKEAVKAREAGTAALEKELNNLLLGIPNAPYESVVKGGGPQDNKVIFEDLRCKREMPFKALDHHAVGEALGILDFAAATKLSGSRFALLRGAGARLERAITQFMLDIQTVENGYTEIFPPFLVTAQTMTGTGQLPKFEEDLYKVVSDPPLYLIPTAEVPLTNMYRGDILKEEELPMRFTAYTACFRQEAGSYGKDTRGLIRNHQFNKVELVWLSRPEDSMSALEKMRSDAEKILQLLKLPYRVVELCAGDMGFSAAKTYDLEVWMPGEGKFREISSVSNCGDFQARRMNTRFKRVDGKKTEFIHTLNGSGLAVGRTFAAILENYQAADGSVAVPEALRRYMGVDRITL